MITILAGAAVVSFLTQPVPDAKAQPAPDHTPGRWDCDVQFFHLKNGVAHKKGLIERAGSPSAVWVDLAKVTAAFVWYPKDNAESFNHIATSVSTDEGATWSAPKVVTIKGLPIGYSRPTEPVLVATPDKKLRLYFTSQRGKGTNNPAPLVYSAVSADGSSFQFEPSARLSELKDWTGRIAVTRSAETWHAFAPSATNAKAPMYHATSSDGLAFKRALDVTFPPIHQPDVEIAWRSACPSPPTASKATMMLIGQQAGTDILWTSESATGEAWTEPVELKNVRGYDPAWVKLADNSSLVVVTTAPRAGSPTDEWLKSRPKTPTNSPPSQRGEGK